MTHKREVKLLLKWAKLVVKLVVVAVAVKVFPTNQLATRAAIKEAEWIFRKHGVLSVTVSAADRLVDFSASELRDLFWRDVALAYRLPSHPVPPARIVKERRATFMASPQQLSRRPEQTTTWSNLLLAGDYVNTGLPATIEGAIRSGFAAARLAINSSNPALTGGGVNKSMSKANQQQHHALP